MGHESLDLHIQTQSTVTFRGVQLIAVIPYKPQLGSPVILFLLVTVANN